MSQGSLSPIRKIRIFIPPSDSPLLTTYSKSLLPKLTPLKQRFSILSKRSQKPIQDPQTVYMSANQLDIVTNSYRKIKRTRGQQVNMKESIYRNDPLYKSIYNLKRQSVKYRAKSRHRYSKLQFNN